MGEHKIIDIIDQTPDQYTVDPVPEATLDQLAVAIHNGTDVVKRQWLTLGRNFYAARCKLPGDLEFGRWCKDNGFEIPARTRHALMTTWQRFGGRERHLGWSVLFELANVPDAEDAIDNRVTAREAREIKKAGSFETWLANKNAKREAAAALVSGDQDAAIRADAKAEKVKEVSDDEYKRRLKEIEQRAMAENPGLKEELEQEEEDNKHALEPAKAVGTVIDRKQQSIQMITDALNPAIETNQRSLTQAYGAWQWLLEAYL